MKLLIFTQKVNKNDPVLGFFCGWLDEFAKNFSEVNVICLEKGEYQNPTNVKIFSLGKENELGRFGYLKNLVCLLWKLGDQYDKVFVHMNPEYVVLCGWWWKLTGKKIFLWYTHRQVDLKLRIAEKFADIIFTSAKESFNIQSQKVRIVGHGISVASFIKPEEIKHSEKFTIISVGRITKIKNLDILLEAVLLIKNRFDFQVLIVGSPALSGDILYFESLKKFVLQNNLQGIVNFVGDIPNDRIKEYYWQSNISVNLSPTGGIDKAVLESMAAGVPVLASNKAFASYFSSYKDKLLFEEKNAKDLADKILSLKSSGLLQKIGQEFSEKAELFDTSTLISKISNEIKNSS
jgi:glycosyltransferase involved in cell wall biosynthesis